MKRALVWLFAILSGFYLVALGWIPDPLPFVDEATALLIFVKATSYLGYDVRRFIPFLGRGKKQPQPAKTRDRVVDV